MDQHPIPQDVTGFQFKLIGSMTVKQFGFVASGVIMAVVLYYLPLNTPLAFLIKLFFVPALGASGVVIAFVPIDGRPIDVMTANFVKALFSPNQYIYHRQGRKMSFSTVTVIKPVVAKVDPKAGAAAQSAVKTHQSAATKKEDQLRALLMNTQSNVKNDLDRKEVAFLKNFPVSTPTGEVTRPTIASPIVKQAALPTTKPLTSVAKPAAPVVAAATPAPALVPAAPKIATPNITPVAAAQSETSESLANKENALAQALVQAKQEETTSTVPAIQTVAHQKVETVEKQIQDIHAQKVQLEQELTKLKSQLTEQKNPAPTPTPVAQTPAVQTTQATLAPAVAAAPVAVPATQPSGPLMDPQHVRTLSQDVSKKVGLPKVSDTPNVVLGIVKDPRGNVLSNILVEVKDKDGNPVRAFKTNPLGQFASATPLSPGSYTMELEDPKKLQQFDVIQVVANNQIMLPIEVISHDAREALRQQLFAN